MLYLTSDLHIAHKNILNYCPNRLNWCHDLDSMNEVLLNDICSLSEDDTLIIVGDFLMNKKASYQMVYDKLASDMNCDLVLINGNHDSDLDPNFKSSIFTESYDYLELTWNNVRFCLSHYPMEQWNNNHGKNNSIHCYGHVHQKPLEKFIPRRINVGVDSLDYDGRIISADEIIKLVEYREQSLNNYVK